MAIGTILPKLALFITLPVITGQLTKAEYGTYDLITTLVSLFLPVATLQVQTAAFRFLIDCKEDERGKKKVITNVVVFVLISSLIALSILFLALFKLSLLVRTLICIYFFADIILMTLLQVVRGLSMPKLYATCTSVQPIANMVLVVILVLFAQGGLVGALISMTAATFLAMVIVILRAHIFSYLDLKLLSKDKMKEMVGYAWPMIPNSLSLWLLNFSDRLVLRQFMGIEAVAVYAAANKVPSMYSLANSAFTLAWQENAAINAKDEDVSAYYGSMFDNILRILSGIMALLIAATPVLFRILIRGDYSDAYRQMPILLMAMFFSSMSSFLGGIYIAHKKTKNVGGTTIIAAVVNVVIDLVCVRFLGIYAASLSTLCAYMFLALYRMWNVQKFQPIRYRYGKMIQYLSVLVILCVMAWINTWYLQCLNAGIAVVFAVWINRKLVKNTLAMLLKKVRKGKKHE